MKVITSHLPWSVVYLLLVVISVYARIVIRFIVCLELSVASPAGGHGSNLYPLYSDYFSSFHLSFFSLTQRI